MRLLKAWPNKETLLRKEMLSSLAARETYAAETIFFAWNQEHFCFLDTNFAFETYVSQFSHDENNVD